MIYQFTYKRLKDSGEVDILMEITFLCRTHVNTRELYSSSCSITLRKRPCGPSGHKDAPKGLHLLAQGVLSPLCYALELVRFRNSVEKESVSFVTERPWVGCNTLHRRPVREAPLGHVL